MRALFVFSRYYILFIAVRLCKSSHKSRSKTSVVQCKTQDTDRSKLFKQKHHYRIYNTFQPELFFLIGLIQIFLNLILQSTASIPKFAFKKTGYLQAIELLFLFGFYFRLFCISWLFCLKRSREGESIIFVTVYKKIFALNRRQRLRKAVLVGSTGWCKGSFFQRYLHLSWNCLLASACYWNVKVDFFSSFFKQTRVCMVYFRWKREWQVQTSRISLILGKVIRWWTQNWSRFSINLNSRSLRSREAIQINAHRRILLGGKMTALHKDGAKF